MVTALPQTEERAIPVRRRIATIVVFATVLLVAVAIDPAAKDTYRGPKEFLLRASAVVLAALAVSAAFRAPGNALETVRRHRLDFILAGSVVGWGIVTTILSTNPTLSRIGLTAMVASAIFYLAARVVARNIRPLHLDLLFVVVIVNSLLATSQALRIWNPLPVDVLFDPLRVTALIGNPNDVGSYLAAPFLLAVCAAAMFHGVRRWAYAFAAVTILVGIVASGTRGAYLAVIAGVAVLAVSSGRRVAIAGVLAISIVVGFALVPGTRLSDGVQKIRRGLESKDYALLFSNRLPSFLAAWEMTKAHPVTGVGPGAFKFHFMSYQDVLRAKYPEDLLRTWPQNFAQVHNDHLQTLAETGLPGYVLFLSAIGVLAAVRFRRPGTSDLARTGRTLSLPLAALFFVLCIAQFPLEIAAPRVTLLFIAAFCRESEFADEA